MNIIEQATRRLEELRRAGIEIPSIASVTAGQAALDPRLARDDTPPATHRRPPREGDVPRTGRTVELDFDKLERQGIVTPRLVNRALAEEMRVIKMQLIKNMEAAAAHGLRRNLILVTSAVPSEGKTFTALNLAMSLALEVDYHALLVDADVLRPSVLQRLGVSAELGLLDLAMRPELDVADVLLRPNVPKLSLLPAGTPNHMSPELLSSAYMNRLLAELSERYADRLVIFDAPPILVASGARHLASRVGQVLMVVQADSTDLHKVSQAFAAVESCPLVSAVLNQYRTTASDYGYYES